MFVELAAILLFFFSDIKFKHNMKGKKNGKKTFRRFPRRFRKHSSIRYMKLLII